MKNFTRRGNWLDQTTNEIRAIYTFFLVFALIGQLTFVMIAGFRIGPSYDKVVEHYRGGGGDEEISFPKEFSELLEVTHFHAYIEGIVLLVLAHLFVVIPISERMKWWVIVVAFGSTLLDLASPWLIRYISPFAAFGQLFAWMGMSVSYLLMTLLPVYFIWIKR